MPIITKNINITDITESTVTKVRQASTKRMAQAIRDFFVNELNWVEQSDIDSGTPADTMYVAVTPTYHDAYTADVSTLCFTVANSSVSSGPYIRIRHFRNNYNTTISSGYNPNDNSTNSLCSWSMTSVSTSGSYVASIQCSFSVFDSDYCTCVWAGSDRYSIFFYIKDAINFFDSSSNNLLIEGAAARSSNNTIWITDDTANIHNDSLSYTALSNNITLMSCYRKLSDRTTPIISRAFLLCSNKIKYSLSDNYFYMSDAKIGTFYNILDNNDNNWLCLCILPNLIVKIKNNSITEELSNNE